MGLKEQFGKLKDNWLLAIIGLVIVFFVLGGGALSSSKMASSPAYNSYGGDYAEMGMAADSSYRGGGYYPPVANEDFAPEETERKITKNTRMSTQVDRGTHYTAEQKLKNILSASDALILNENVNTRTVGTKEYTTGSYSIKVETGKYDAVVNQLKEIGEVKSFNEQATDITGRYTNTEIEIVSEKGRLARYEEMYTEARNVDEKIKLTDKIYDLERRIKYLEDSLTNMDLKVEYSTINFSLNEEQPSYANAAIVKFGELWKAFVGSLNSLLYLLFMVIPYAVVLLLYLWIRRMVKNRQE